jgi:hypothetical protein
MKKYEYLIGTYRNKEVLYVTDSTKSQQGLNSHVVIFGRCSSLSSMRSYVTGKVMDEDVPLIGIIAYGSYFYAQTS